MKNTRLKLAQHCFLTLGVALVLGSLVSCGRRHSKNDYIATVQSGIEVLPWPKQMEALFGGGDHFILYYGISSGPKKWNSQVFFHGRYKLTMETQVVIDDESRTIKPSASSPMFYMQEVKSITFNNGRPTAFFADEWKFGEDQWKKLVQAKGDWSVLGIPVRTNDPVPGFDAYVKACRAPFEKIPH